MQNINEIKKMDKNTISKYIKEKCYRKVKTIYGENLPYDIEERLKLELDSIIKNNFEIKYLVTSEVAKKSKEMGYLSYTKGSVGNSFVAFLLEITDFNPIKYNLSFEIFAGIKYDKKPDIEIYISEEIIEKILDEVKDVKEEIKIRGTNLPTFLKKLQDETKINPQNIDFNDKDTLNLFAKSHSIIATENSFRIAWYKVHYPEAFYKVYFETNKTININYYYTKKDVERKLKRLYDEQLGIWKNGYNEEKS